MISNISVQTFSKAVRVRCATVLKGETLPPVLGKSKYCQAPKYVLLSLKCVVTNWLECCMNCSAV